MFSSTSYHNCKCGNANHTKQATELGNQPVHPHDVYTMNVHVENNVATLQCFWCEFTTTVDLTIRPLILTYPSGKTMTIRASA